MPGGVQMLPLIVGAIEDKSGADGAKKVATRSDIEDAGDIEDVELITDPPEEKAQAAETKP